MVAGRIEHAIDGFHNCESVGPDPEILVVRGQVAVIATNMDGKQVFVWPAKEPRDSGGALSLSSWKKRCTR